MADQLHGFSRENLEAIVHLRGELQAASNALARYGHRTEAERAQAAVNTYGVVPTRKLSDKIIEEIAGKDELTGDAILAFAHRLLNMAEPQRCGYCNGLGNVTSDYYVTIRCPRCNGTGKENKHG